MILGYLLLLLAANAGPVQRWLARVAEDALEERLQTEVHIGSVEPQLFNRVVLHDVQIKDRQNAELLSANLISAKIEYRALLQKKVSLRSVSMLDGRIALRKDRPDSAANYQFFLDAFKGDGKKPSRLNLALNSLILRRCTVAYDERYRPRTPRRFSPSHVRVSDLDANISLKCLTPDSLNLRVRRLRFKEQSGLDVQNISLRLMANRRHAEVRDFDLRLAHSRLYENELSADYDLTRPGQFLKTLSLRGTVRNAYLCLQDFAPFAEPLAALPYQLRLSSSFAVRPGKITVDCLTLEERELGFRLSASAALERRDGKVTDTRLHVDEISLPNTLSADLARRYATEKAQALVSRAGDVTLKADAQLSTDGVSRLTVDATTVVGDIYASAHWRGDDYMAQLSSASLSLHQLFARDDLPDDLAFHADVKARRTNGRFADVNASLLVDHCRFRGYDYSNLSATASLQAGSLSATLSSADPNLALRTDVHAAVRDKHLQSVQATVSVENLNAAALNLSDVLGRSSYAGLLSVSLPTLSTQHLRGEVCLSQFRKTPHDGSSPFTLSNLSLSLTPSAQGTHAHLESDFAQADVDGPLQMNRLKDQGRELLACALPDLFPRQSATPSRVPSADRWVVKANVQRDDVFSQLLGVPLRFDAPILVDGYLAPCGQRSSLLVSAPSLTYGSMRIDDFRLYVQGSNGELSSLVHGTKKMGKQRLRFALSSSTRDGGVDNNLTWQSTINDKYRGELSARTTFSRTLRGGTAATTRFLPTQMVFADSVWHMAAGDVTLHDGRISVNHLGLSHADQSLRIDGDYSGSAADTLTVLLNRFDVAYIISIANLRPVSFQGEATGRATVAPKASGGPDIRGRLHIPAFRFNDALMGDADINLQFTPHDVRLYLDADMREAGVGSTVVKGYVGIKEKELDLHIDSKNTTLELLRRYVPGIFSDLTGRTSGWCRIYGPFKRLDFEGEERANAFARVNAIGCGYHLADGTVNISSGVFQFDNFTVTDDFGGRGTFAGALRHDHLKNLSYDFTAHTDHLRIYDKPRQPDLSFFATASGTGTARLYGRPGEFGADIDMVPEEGSIITYFVENADASTDSRLLRYGQKQSDLHVSSVDSLLASSVPAPASPSAADDDTPTSSMDIRLNFKFNMTPKARLRVITNEHSGDNITLAGDGTIRATFYNKGNFQMFGNFTVDNGQYKMVFQDILHRDFQFYSGGTIVFGGDAYEGDLNLQAVYTVPGVTLSDLGFNLSDKSTRADCILNLTGKVKAPQVSFDLNLPSVSAETQQMVRQLIATEEDMNLQVMYLLGVGRFYNYNYAASDAASDGQQQSAVAMKSFLSNTLSGQINNVIQQAVGQSNWTFGANLSTGQVGWSDMEVGGLLSGKMFSNRLIFNGSFGYRERTTSNTNFVGDFNLEYLLTPQGSVRLKAYSETNDRYFSKTSMTTQGVGIVLKRDFTTLKDLFRVRRRTSNDKK